MLVRRFFTRERGFCATVYRTRFAGDATAVARRLVSEGCDVVVAVGGDGTVNEVAQALVHTGTALGIVPAGSGNGLARHLRIPMDVRKALERIATAKTCRMDYGIMNGMPFFCTAGVGFDALIGHLFAQAGVRGVASYARQILRAFTAYKPEQYVIAMEGETIRRTAFLITFANASQWGNNACIAPSASASDGLIDVVVMGKFPLYRAPEIAVRLFTRRIDKLPFVEIFRCRAATVGRAHGGYIHYDGESSETGRRIEVAMVQGGLTVVC